MAEDNKQAAKNAAKSAAELKKQKKKRWCPILAPEIFQSRVIGESLLDDSSLLMKKTITVNMMQLLGDMKRQNVSILFKVIDVKEGKGLTEPVRYVVAQSSLRRLAKREKDKLSDSFVVKTSDGKFVRVKPVMVTNNKTKGSVQTALLKNCRAVTKEIVNATPFMQLFSDLVAGKLQKDIKGALHRVYPLRIFDIRMLGLETRKKKESIEEEELLKLKKEKEAQEAEKFEEEEQQAQVSKSKNSGVKDSEDFGSDADDIEESGSEESGEDSSDDESEE